MNLCYIISKIIKKIQLPAITNSNIDRHAKICSASQIVNTSLGRYSYIGNSCTIINADIGRFSSIADNCIVGGASHPIDWVSTSPVFYKGKNVLKKNFSDNEYISMSRTVIGNDVWIGSNALIKGGIKIGDGSVVGMGAVVTRNIGDYEVWAGNPAKLIKKRFEDDLIVELLKIQWWDFIEQDLKKYGHLTNDIEQFIASSKKRSSR